MYQAKSIPSVLPFYDNLIRSLHLAQRHLDQLGPRRWRDVKVFTVLIAQLAYKTPVL